MGGTGTDPERYVNMLTEVGIRCYTGPSYRNADYVHDSEGRIEYDWNDERGLERFKQAISFVKKFNGAAHGRINAMLFPGHVDTCSPDLFRETKKAAKELGVRTQTHCGINMIEFNTVMRKYRCTPVEFLHKLGFLGPEVSLSHCVFLSQGHSWTAYPYGDDIKRIADSGASVPHNPLKYMKLGTAIESFDRYLKAGINVTLGNRHLPAGYYLRNALCRTGIAESFELDHCPEFLLSASISRSPIVFHHSSSTITLAPLIKRPARYSQHPRHFLHRPRPPTLKLLYCRSAKLFRSLLTHFLFLSLAPLSIFSRMRHLS